MKKKVWKVNGQKVFVGEQNYFDLPVPQEKPVAYFDKAMARPTSRIAKKYEVDPSKITSCGSSISYGCGRSYTVSPTYGCGGLSFSSCG